MQQCVMPRKCPMCFGGEYVAVSRVTERFGAFAPHTCCHGWPLYKPWVTAISTSTGVWQVASVACCSRFRMWRLSCSLLVTYVVSEAPNCEKCVSNNCHMSRSLDAGCCGVQWQYKPFNILPHSPPMGVPVLWQDWPVKVEISHFLVSNVQSKVYRLDLLLVFFFNNSPTKSPLLSASCCCCCRTIPTRARGGVEAPLNGPNHYYSQIMT